MSAKITKKEIRSFNRIKECEKFRSIIRRETQLRGLILYSKGHGGTGKTTLLKMFESECLTIELPKPAVVLFFTANNRPLEWQMILDKTVDMLGTQHFTTYIRIREAYTGSVKEASKIQPAITYETHIQSVQGSVHTGSGDIKSAQVIETSTGSAGTSRTNEQSIIKEDIRVSITDAFLQDYRNLSRSLQLIWLIDTTERLDDSTLIWLTDIYYKIVEDDIDSLVLVTAGRELLCSEPYWIDKIEELYIGNFNEEIVSTIVQRIWPTKYPALHEGMVKLLMAKSDGKPMDLITEIERFNPYD